MNCPFEFTFVLSGMPCQHEHGNVRSPVQAQHGLAEYVGGLQPLPALCRRLCGAGGKAGQQVFKRLLAPGRAGVVAAVLV